MSSIVTFYSYKGGVGRSMALANVAVLLARRGLKVLAVDWDLEAPGLERYFSYFKTGTVGPGLLNMLLAQRDSGKVDFDKYTLTIDCKASAPVTLLTSGREQDENYSHKLETFDWSDFFARGGGAFLEKLRAEWRSRFDVVLLDSRTGLSDAGGVCTILLPDVVVAMFTANHQSLYGVRDVMRLAQRARQSLAYVRMPLTILPLPSRWGVQEFSETQVWLDRTVEGMREFYADWLPKSVNPRSVVEQIKVPHHSYFGFGERLAVEEQGVSDPTGMGYIYDKIAAFLASDFKDLAALVGRQVVEAETKEPPHAVPPSSDISVEDHYKYDVFVSFDSSLAELVAEIVPALTEELRLRGVTEPRVHADITVIQMGVAWRADIEQSMARSKVMLALVTPRYFASEFSSLEFQTFVERGQITGARTLLPVALYGEPGEFPDSFKQLASLDGKSLLDKTTPSRRSSEWFRAISEIGDNLVHMVNNAPPFDPAWAAAKVQSAPQSSVVAPPISPVSGARETVRAIDVSASLHKPRAKSASKKRAKVTVKKRAKAALKKLRKK
jgi:cellulose biosynthesis protein BcsQ